MTSQLFSLYQTGLGKPDLAAHMNRSVLHAVVIGEACTQTLLIDCLCGSQSLMSEMPPVLKSAVCQLVN